MYLIIHKFKRRVTMLISILVEKNVSVNICLLPSELTGMVNSSPNVLNFIQIVVVIKVSVTVS